MPLFFVPLRFGHYSGIIPSEALSTEREEASMKLPKIRNLDLRETEKAQEIKTYGMFWDWPHFPVDTLTFINTGIRPTASKNVNS